MIAVGFIAVRVVLFRLSTRSFEGLRPLALAALQPGAGAASAVDAVRRLQARHADLPLRRPVQTKTKRVSVPTLFLRPQPP